MLVKIILIGLYGMSFSSCLSKSVDSHKSPESIRSKWAPIAGQPLWKDGPSYMGRWTLAGEKIFYLQGGIGPQNQTQIHSFDLKEGLSRRVTFNSGFDMGFTILNRTQRIIYSSSSDEGIENPLFIQSFLGKKTNDDFKKIFGFSSDVKNQRAISELYVSDFFGRNIQRITHSKGFDGFPTVDKDEKHLVFSSYKHGQINLYRKNLRNLKKAPIRLTRSKAMSLEPQISPNGKNIVWLEKTFKRSQLMISSWPRRRLESKKLLDVASHLGSLVWHPSGSYLIFSARSFQDPHSKLFLLKTDGSCLVPITQHLSSHVYPSFDMTGENMLYGSNRGGQYQLYMVPFKLPSPCPMQAIGVIMDK